MKIISYRFLPEKYEEEILDLLCNSFPGDIEYLKSVFLKKFESKEKQNWHIAFDNNIIHGVLNICYRTMNFKGFELSVCGLSSMAISKSKQNKGLSQIFQNIALEESNFKDISLGFARKKMDGFWAPKGFVGITDFAEFSILTNEMISFDESKSIKLINYENKFFSELQRLSVLHNYLIVGNLKRETWHWEDIIVNKIKNYILKLLTCNGKVVGYLIFKENIIIEFYCEEKYNYQITYALKIFFRDRNVEKLIFRINLNNPFLYFLSNFNHNLNKRFAFDGGHILRVNNYEKILEILGTKFLENLSVIDYSNHKLKIDKEHFIFEKTSKKVILKNEKFKNCNEKTKFLFGLQKYNDAFYQIIFPNQYVQFSLLDAF